MTDLSPQQRFLLGLLSISVALLAWDGLRVAGLVHGFGFSFGLSEIMQFAGSNLITSLAAFNIEVEIGQIMLILVYVLRFWLRQLRSERLGAIVLSVLIAHIAWHWLSERWDILSKFPRPTVDVLLVTGLMQALAVGLILGGLMWLVSGSLDRWLSRSQEPRQPVASGDLDTPTA